MITEAEFNRVGFFWKKLLCAENQIIKRGWGVSHTMLCGFVAMSHTNAKNGQTSHAYKFAQCHGKTLSI
jgi:hypothetical protein